MESKAKVIKDIGSAMLILAKTRGMDGIDNRLICLTQEFLCDALKELGVPPHGNEIYSELYEKEEK